MSIFGLWNYRPDLGVSRFGHHPNGNNILWGLFICMLFRGGKVENRSHKMILCKQANVSLQSSSCVANLLLNWVTQTFVQLN